MSQVKWSVEHLVHVDSTNTWLAQRARGGANPGLAVYSDYQSAGRGRLDREWHAPAGTSLLGSALLEAPASPTAPQWVVVAAALALGDALELLSGRRPVLKWPNDVLYGDLKVAGLLAEVVAREHGALIVVGVGLNLTNVDPVFAAATSVREATGLTLSPADVLAPYLDALGRRYERLASPEGTRALAADYIAHLSTLGQRVRIELVGAQVHGRAVGIDDDGALKIDTGNAIRTFSAGDVVHVRREDTT